MSAINPSQYQPRYVTLDAIPLVEKRTYTDTEKREALFSAESELELDTNNGLEIEDDEITHSHQNAVANLGTYYLTKSQVTPESTTLGDMSDESSEAANTHAKKYFETYKRIVSGINDADGTVGGKTHKNIAVNTRSRDKMDHTYPFQEDDRFPDDDRL
jgi:hypothetical protein